ncbi:MAG TPA: serine/threonine-protein kinase [Ktedonobacteraceae bacterium]|nr:serine/threonine-protein kinase [Ktedonobacteraceae bacterium]
MAYCCTRQHINDPHSIWCEQCESLVAGALIDDFKVVSYIGSGSFSKVYLAEQQSLNMRKVVIKLLHQPWDQVQLEFFQREAALLASLAHPYILPIYAFGVISQRNKSPYGLSYSQTPGSLPYLVLPYVAQGSIAEIFEREGKQPWSLARVVSLTRHAAEALDYAHGRGVLHRDVKPANLLQMGSHVLLADFSVASMIDANVSHVSAPWAGSPAYMAPEVWGQAPGRYSDQYALAVTCFYLLTAEYPWQSRSENNMRTWIHLHRTIAPRSLHELRPDLPQAVSLVLQRALAKDPHQRFPTLQTFAAALDAASQTAIPALRPSGGLGTLQPQGAINLAPTSVQGTPWSQSARDLKGPPQAPLLALTSPQSAEVVQHPAITAKSALPISSSLPVESHINEKVWEAMLFNLLLCMVLAAVTAWQFGEVRVVGNVLLALWPSLPVGLWVARMFRSMRSDTICWSLCRGALFGVADIVLSALVCYAWTALALTMPHWGHDWLQAGDGLRIFIEQVKALLPEFLKLFVLGAWIAVTGGVLIGIFSFQGWRGQSHRFRSQQGSPLPGK